MKRLFYLFTLVGFVACIACIHPNTARGQLVSQSDLTIEDTDSSFRLTLEHLSQGPRGLGVPPRDITWAPDGQEVFFRWNANPSLDQPAETDPWFVVNRSGTQVRRLADEEVYQVPTDNITWSHDRKVAAWSRNGTLYMWRAETGTRITYSTDEAVGNLSIGSSAEHIFFATQGLEEEDSRSADLWAYDTRQGQVQQLVEVVPQGSEGTSFEQWVRREELNLIPTHQKRQKENVSTEQIRRAREVTPVVRLPIEEDAKARDIQLSPDSNYITFRWVKPPRGDHTTQFMEFVNEDGYATPRRARPKVGAPLPTHKMGIVPYEPTTPSDSLTVTWVDDDVDKQAIIHGPYWNPQGTQAVVQILSIDHKDRWIARLDPATGQTTILHHERESTWIGGPLVGGRWAPGYLRWLPNGEAFAFVSAMSGWSMLYLADLEGEVRPLTQGEWEVRDAQLSPDGQTWYLVTSKKHPGEEHLYHLPAQGGKLQRITMGEGIHRPVVSPNGDRLATTYETSRRMPDLYLQDNRAGDEKTRITKSGTDTYYRYAWANSEIISYPDPQGKATWAEVWDQPDVPNLAAIVYAHGCGECAQAVDKGWTRVGAMLYANYMRQRGFVMASLDYRGSAGYGHDNRTYAYRQMGITDVDSALPLLDILVEQRSVDRNRIGIYGGSYGGFFTIMSLLRHPGTYAAGVSLYPVTDWAHYNQGYTSRILNGTPIDDPEAYRQSSPIYYAENLEDALQIQHGLVDNNVQIQDSFRLAQRLIDLQRDFDMVVYPVEDHGWDEPSTRRDSYKRMTRWFENRLLGNYDVAFDGPQGNR